MRETVRDIVQPVASQTDAPKPRLPVGQEVRHVRESVRQHARVGHAPPDAQAVARVRCVRETVLATLAAPGTPPLAHGREAVRMCSLRQGVRRPFQPARAHADALCRQELRLYALPQVLRPQVLPQQTPRVRVLQGRRK